MESLKIWRDKILGRGEAAITIPTLDGALKPNQMLEDANILAEFQAPEDLCTDGKSLFLAEGKAIFQLKRGVFVKVLDLSETITAMACIGDGGIVVALNGRQIKIYGGQYDGKGWSEVEKQPLLSVNAISMGDNGQILVTEGSTLYPYENWCHDLMDQGHTGRVFQIDPVSGKSLEICTGLHFPFGCCDTGSEIWISETWKHRLLSYQFSSPNDTAEPIKAIPSTTILDWLPGYPCRITRASDGGFWLAAFAGRTQLVEFVLREKHYRKRMVEEVDPRYWIAPALSSGDDFLEPLQGAGVKMRGVLKPYAPPRSYGLLIRLDKQGVPISSFQSRLDGKNHGVVKAVECKGVLYVLAKGPGRILQLPLA